MKEYIERQAVEEFIQDGLNNPDKSKAFGHDAIEILAGIHFMLAADVVEVRHGHWIGEIDDRDGHIWMECSECHKIRIVDDFCGACGARMEKEDEHEAD